MPEFPAICSILSHRVECRRKAKGLDARKPRGAEPDRARGLEAAKKSRPAAFFTAETARLDHARKFRRQSGMVRRSGLDHRSGRRKSGDQAQVVRASGSGAQAGDDCHVEHIRIADPADRRGALGGFSAALGGNAFLQSAALHETGGADSRAEDAAGSARRRSTKFATCGWAKAWWSRKTRRISSPTASARFRC